MEWNDKWNTRAALRIHDIVTAANNGSLDAASKEEELLQRQYPLLAECPAPAARFERLPGGDYPARDREVGILENGVIAAEGCDRLSDPVRIRVNG